jgi:hypothetical protein
VIKRRLIVLCLVVIGGCGTIEQQGEQLNGVIRGFDLKNCRAIGGPPMAEFNAELLSVIWDNFDPPPYKEGKFKGLIRLLLGSTGDIEEIVIMRLSGYPELDDAAMKAVKLTSNIPLPTDTCVKRAFIIQPKILWFDESDLVKPK